MRSKKFPERIPAVADLVFDRGIKLAKRFLVAHGNEDRIVAKAATAPWRPNENSVDPAVESLRLAIIGPGDGERAREVSCGIAFRFACFDFAPDFLHRACPVAMTVLVLGPACGEDPRTTVKSIDAQAAIVGKRWQAAEVGGLARLEVG